MSEMKHLSVIDGAFLHLESPEMPMHVGSLALFDAPPGDAGAWYEAVKAHVASRMHLAPVFTRKLALMPFDLANPVWIHDDDIDLEYHMRYLVLPKPGTMAQMEALCARLHSSLLDRSRPLWEFYVIEGLADGRLGFYSKVHHSAVDGQAAVAMANSIFDVTQEPRRVKPPRAVRSNRYQLGVAELLGAALTNQARQVLQFAALIPPLAGAAVGAARAALAARRAGVKSSVPKRFKLAPATPFNTSITNQRAFAGVSLPLKEDMPFPAEVFEKSATRRVNLGLILSEVVRVYGLQAKPEQVRAAIEALAQSYEHPQELVKWYYQSPERLRDVEALALEENVVEWALKTAKVEDKPMTFDELMENK